MIVLPCVEQIRMARAALGWSQMVLAEKANLSVETIKRIETGKNTTTASLKQIAEAFLAYTVTFEPYDATEFNDTGPIVRMRVKMPPEAKDWYGSKGQ